MDPRLVYHVAKLQRETSSLRIVETDSYSRSMERISFKMQKISLQKSKK